MTRKKVLNDISEADAAANLRDDEEIVMSDVRTIRKNKRKPPEPPKVEDDDDDFTDAELIDDNPFPAGTVGYRAFGDDSDANAVTECNILVVRKPDGAGDNFLKPCKSRVSEPPIRNVELSSTESEIEEIVRANCGGGHYYLQTQFGNRHGRGWTVSLSDPPEAIAKAKSEQTAAHTAAEPPPPAQTPAADPLDSMLNSLAKMKQLKDALFGDEETRMQRRIDELERQIAEKPEPRPDAPLPENLQILEKALATTNPTLQEKLLDYAFPPAESSHWIADTLKTVLEHKDEIGSILGSVLNGLLPKPPPPTQQGIAAILAGPAPTTAIQPSQFQRKNFPRADDGENADASADDGKTDDDAGSTEPKIKSEETENGDS